MKRNLVTVAKYLASVLLLGFVTPVMAQAGLIAHYTFDEGVGSQATDTSGNGNTGTVHGATWGTGQVAGALNFDGDNDYVEIPHTPALALISGNFTLSAWFYARSTGQETNGRLFDKGGASGGGDGWSVQMNTGGWYISNNSTTPVLQTPDGSASLEAWHHFVFTQSSGTGIAYIDGVVSAVQSEMPAPVANNAVPLRIGLRATDTNRDFDGLIDDVRIYDNALSPAEVNTLFTNAGGTPTPALTFSANPVAITAGSASTLSWTSTNATSCTASNGWTGSQSTSGSQSVSPTALTVYTLVCSGNGKTVIRSVTVSISGVNPTPTSSADFPLSIDAARRHLIDRNGTPFLINGDTAWSLMVEATREEIDAYLDDRAAKGFNAIMVEMMESGTYGGPANEYGETPFSDPDDFTTINEAYFQHVDYVINAANDRGIVLFMMPLYLGFGGGGDGWRAEMQTNGATKTRDFGVFVGDRYKDFDNIVWMMGGDHSPSDFIDITRVLIEGVAIGGGKPVIASSHNARFQSAIDTLEGETWLNLNNTYADCEEVAFHSRQDYLRSGPLPFFYMEGAYESGGGNGGNCMRAQAYVNILLGSTGHFFGNFPIWRNPETNSAYNSQGSQDMARMAQLFHSRDWSQLVPDIDHTILTTGFGDINDSSYAAAALASTGETLIAYFPDQRPVTVDLSKLNGSQVQVWWYNPATGVSNNAGIYDTSIVDQELISPFDRDSVLVIDDIAAALPAPATSVYSPVPALAFSASATTIASGETTTLNWSATNATSCAASNGWNGTKDTSGSETVSPVSTTTYSLACSGSAGSVSRGVTITVTATSDVTAPVLSAVRVTAIGNNLATILWTSDEAATGHVDYGTTPDFGFQTPSESRLTIAHRQPLSGLAAATRYYFRVTSADASGNQSVSSTRTFTTTPPQTNPDLPVNTGDSTTENKFHPAALLLLLSDPES